MSFIFEVVNKKEAKIVKYLGKEKNLIIPSFTFINDKVYEVTMIDKYALNNSNIKKLFIPKTIKNIHLYAFLGFNKLNIEEFIVDEKNNNYSSIDGNLFNKDKTVFIKYATASLKNEYKIPSTVEVISSSAFEDAINLKKVKLPNNLKVIEEYAFAFCPNLKNIELPNSLEVIGNYAFLNHEKIENIKIKENLKDIGEGAFYSIRKPSINISISSSNKNFKIYKGGLYSYNKNVLYKYLYFNDEVYLSSHLKEIKPYAFAYLYLDRVVMPENIEIIGEKTFMGSTISEILLPNNLKVISKSMFEYCKYLKEIKLPSNLETIEALAFSLCSSLSVLELPSSIKYLGDSFISNTKIKKLKLNNENLYNNSTLKGSIIKTL